MKGGFLLGGKAIGGGNGRITESVNSSGSAEWSEDVSNAFLEACQEALDRKARMDLERRVRSGTGTSSSCQHHHHDDNGGDEEKDCGHSHHHHSFRTGAGDAVGEALDDWTTDDRLSEIGGAVAERASTVYDNVKSKGRAEGMHLGEDEDKEIRRQCLKEALVREIHKRVMAQIRSMLQADSLEAGLLATPAGYKDGPLAYLSANTIRDLMVDGVAVQENFMGHELRKKILSELEMREYDGKMTDAYRVSISQPHRKLSCWLTMTDLDRHAESGLHALCTRLHALPFELNKKANLLLQSALHYELNCYRGDGGYFRYHFDNSFDPQADTGRKISVFYLPNGEEHSASDGGVLRVQPRRSFKAWKEKKAKGDENSPPTAAGGEARSAPFIEVLPGPDKLVLLRSRDMEYEVTETRAKRFDVGMYIMGPIGAGDDQ